MALTRPSKLIKEDISGSVANPTTNISGSSVKRKAVRTVLGPIVKILKNNYSN